MAATDVRLTRAGASRHFRRAIQRRGVGSAISTAEVFRVGRWRFLTRDPLVATSGSAYGYTDGNPSMAPTPAASSASTTHSVTTTARVSGSAPGTHGPLLATAVVAGVVALGACIIATVGICAGVTPGVASAVSGAAPWLTNLANLGNSEGAGPKFSCTRDLISHFTKHVVDQGEFAGSGLNSPADYLAGASNLVSGGSGVSSFTEAERQRPVSLVYRAATNEFGIVNSSGSIRGGAVAGEGG